MSSLVTTLAFPRSTISIEGIPLFHFENAFLAKEAPRLTRSILNAVHYRMFAVAVRTGLGFAHGSQAWLHILEPFVGNRSPASNMHPRERAFFIWSENVWSNKIEHPPPLPNRLRSVSGFSEIWTSGIRTSSPLYLWTQQDRSRTPSTRIWSIIDRG